jgi:hypothetical protein
MNPRFFIPCLLVALYQLHVQAPETNLNSDTNAINIFRDTGISTKLVATGEWSKPVSDGHGTKISGRLLVYDGAYLTNEMGKPTLFAAPVFLEIHNEMGTLTQIYFEWEFHINFELRDVNGKPANVLKQNDSGSYTIRRPYWASVPANGLLRLRANGNTATQFIGTGHPKPGGLSLFFSPSQDWLIPADDTNNYFLSTTFLAKTTNSSPDNHDVWQAMLEFPAVKLSAVKN